MSIVITVGWWMLPLALIWAWVLVGYIIDPLAVGLTRWTIHVIPASIITFFALLTRFLP